MPRWVAVLISSLALGGSGAPAWGASASPATSPPPTTSPSPTPAPAPGAPSPPSTPPRIAKTRITRLPPRTLDDATAPFRVRLSGAPAPGSPSPTLTPKVAGTWSTEGDYERFAPRSAMQPCATYTMTVWGGTTATAQLPLGRRRTVSMHVACPPVRGLQQTLARLDYLPYVLHSHKWENAHTHPESRAQASLYAYHPVRGNLLASARGAPGLRYGSYDLTTKSAVIVFQAAHGLAPTGVADERTWTSLLEAEALGHRDQRPYTWVTVSERLPETLQIHQGGHIALTTPVNTGVPGAVTQTGTFPIYARYTSTTMTGTNPDGTHYSDPGVPWVNYFNGGDAVHGFPRPSYGTPQSNGCVELPIPTAERAYWMLSIGDLVIVEG